MPNPRRRATALIVLGCTCWLATSAVAQTWQEETQALIAELELQAAPAPIAAPADWRPRRVLVTLMPAMGMAGAEFEAALRAAAGDQVELILDSKLGLQPRLEALEGVDAFLGMCTDTVLQRTGDSLRWLHSYSVGVDHCRDAAVKLQDRVTFSNSKRLSAPAIAEHTIAMLLALTHQLPAYHQAQSQGSWQRQLASRVTFGELQGRTLLVAGLGGIGTEIAWRAHGLGMRVIATRNSSREGPDFVDYVGTPEELHKLAAQADVVANALPLTPQTTGVFNAAFFEALKPGAIYLSVGRGGSTVTADLVDALRAGRLYGAGLDVTDPEPLPADHPLWRLPNVIITPHVAAAGAGTDRRAMLLAVENLRRYVAREPLLNIVDMERGY